MTKAAIIISAILLLAGVAAASSLTSIGGSDTPTVDTPLSTSTGDDDRQADQRGVEDVRGPCDEAEHVNDPRCTGAAGTQARGEDGDRHNRGPGNTDDSGHGEGNRGGSSGPGGGGHDD